MTGRLRKTIVLVGMMGAGKTAVGIVLARMLAVPFLDSDDEIVKAAHMTIAEIFARDGEEFFRARESEVLRRLLETPPCVLSTGGGAFLAQVNRDLIAAQGVSVWLNAEIDLLWARVRHKANRPLLRTAQPLQTLRDLHAARAPIYATAEVIVESRADYSVEDMATQVVMALTARPDVLERA